MLARILTALVGIPIVLGACFSTSPFPFGGLLVIAGSLAVAEGYRICRQIALSWPLATVVVLVWILLPLYCLGGMQTAYSLGRPWPWDFHTPLLLVFLPLWAGDSAAIFAGKAFGKHLLAPTISPKKTWEGAVANFFACVLAAWGTGIWVGIGPIWAVLIGVITGIVGQAGDLFESWLKRKAGVKDSSNLLPGHGGILDRIDSLLFAAIPATVVYMIASSR